MRQGYVFGLLLWFVLGCTPAPNNKPQEVKPMNPILKARQVTPEELASMKIDYSAEEVKTAFNIIKAATRVMAGESTVEKETDALGRGRYNQPKSPAKPINAWSSHFWFVVTEREAAFKGFSQGFLREDATSPWNYFGFDIQQPYEYTVTFPVTKAFFEALDLQLFKTVENYDCQTPNGKCHAFFYKSKNHPKLGYIFWTNPEQSDLT